MDHTINSVITKLKSGDSVALEDLANVLCDCVNKDDYRPIAKLLKATWTYLDENQKVQMANILADLVDSNPINMETHDVFLGLLTCIFPTIPESSQEEIIFRVFERAVHERATLLEQRVNATNAALEELKEENFAILKEENFAIKRRSDWKRFITPWRK